MRHFVLVLLIVLANTIDVSAEPYDRENWHKGWVDADADCQDTRQEVLARDSLVPVSWDVSGCKVSKGKWFDPYTGETFIDPGKLDIDHMVPLAEAHISGGEFWDSDRRREFANDLALGTASLIAVKASANRSKGARDPSKWLPQREEFHCEYLMRWIAVKLYWNLSFDLEERNAISLQLLNCI